MFETLTDSFTSAIKKIRFHDDEKALKKALGELKKSLLKADVHHSVVRTLLAEVEHKTKMAGIGKDQFLGAMRESLNAILDVRGNQGFVFAPNPPTVILMTGLQGSGKTTTLHSCVGSINTPERKIWTVEDPVEYQMDGIGQAAGGQFEHDNRHSPYTAYDPDLKQIESLLQLYESQHGNDETENEPVEGLVEGENTDQRFAGVSHCQSHIMKTID